MNEPDMAERDLLNRAEDYQRRYHVQEVEQAPDKETYLYYSTQRPIDIGTYPNSYFNRPVHMEMCIRDSLNSYSITDRQNEQNQ